jgi:hypothetical protein
MPDFLVRKVPLDRRPALGPEGDSASGDPQ